MGTAVPTTPPPATREAFLGLLRRSGLVEEQRLDAYLRQDKDQPTRQQEIRPWVATLVRDGLLTHFHAEQLLMGKWRGFRIGNYRILERLGTGGMGLVYLGEHATLRRRVAVKVLARIRAADPAMVTRFYREARAAAALKHPNLVRAYDIGQDDDLHYLIMEYIEGADLQVLVDRHGPLSIPRAAHYIRQVALGLQHAHEAGFVHRDIKPGNLLLDRQGVVKILDLGLALSGQPEQDVLTRGVILGSADYLAPEQALDSHQVDIRADIYSLGSTCYYLLTGRPPFGDAKTVTQKLIFKQTRQPRPIRELRPEVPEELAAVVARMLANDPDERYRNPAEVAAALAPWTQVPIPPPPATELPQLCPAARKGAPIPSAWDVTLPPPITSAAPTLSSASPTALTDILAVTPTDRLLPEPVSQQFVGRPTRPTSDTVMPGHRRSWARSPQENQCVWWYGALALALLGVGLAVFLP